MSFSKIREKENERNVEVSTHLTENSSEEITSLLISLRKVFFLNRNQPHCSHQICIWTDNNAQEETPSGLLKKYFYENYKHFKKAEQIVIGQ